MTYAISDLHGCPLGWLTELLDKAGFTDDDTCYVIGDVMDRGEHGVELMQWLMARPNFILISGNHEQMMLRCDFLLHDPANVRSAFWRPWQNDAYNHWMRNGALPTIEGFAAVSADEREAILRYVRDLPLYAEVSAGGRDFVLVHGGLENFSEDKPLSEYLTDELVWTRPKPGDRYFGDKMTVIGHTPTMYFGGTAGKAYRTDTWIDIDAGAAAGLPPMLLRLDDMEEIYLDKCVAAVGR